MSSCVNLAAMGTREARLTLLLFAGVHFSLSQARLCDVDPGMPNILVLPSQDWVDWFGREGCTEVPGGIYIGGDVHDLSPLRSLASIGVSDYGWSLLIQQAQELETLSGFSGAALTTLPGTLRVEHCPRLLSLEGLEVVVSVSSLILWALPQLQVLHGLRGLGSRGPVSLGDLMILECPKLRSLQGLEGLNSAGSIYLWKLPLLEDLRGLAGLQGALAGGVSMRGLSSLGSLVGLEAVTGLGTTYDGWSLELMELPLLTSLAPLQGLRGRMPGGLDLGDCPLLPSLRGLGNISSFGSGPDGLALSLWVLDIMSLEGLDGLRGNLSGGISITSCHELLTLEGLEGLTMVGRAADGSSLHVQDVNSLTSLQGLEGLMGTLPGGLKIGYAPALTDLEGLQGLSGVCSDGCFEHGAITFQSMPSLKSVLGLRGLRGSLAGALWLNELSALLTLSGLEGLTSIPTLKLDSKFRQISVNIECRDLESLDGLGGLTGTINGTIHVVSGRLQSLEAVSESITLSAGHLHISTGTPVCDRATVLERLRAMELHETPRLHLLQVPPGQPQHCRSCPEPCRSYRDRRVTCDVLRGGCRCPLGRAGPDCLETPVLDVALSPDAEQRTLRIRTPLRQESTARRLDLCLPLRRRGSPTSESTAVRFRELLSSDACPSRDAGYSLLPPYNSVRWSSNDPSRGCLMVHLEVWRSRNCSSPLRLVLAYESPSGGRYPDHLINRTLREVGDPWDHPWPECLHIGTCSEEQGEMALIIYFVEQEDCPQNMELDLTVCEASLCPGATAPPSQGPGATVPELQTACECHQGHALEGRCVAKPGHWALDDGTSAVPCPIYSNGESTCLGRNRCFPGYEGVMCATCPGATVLQNGSCGACSSWQGIVCVIIALLFLTAAASLPHLLRWQCLWQVLGSCLSRGGPTPVWPRLWTKLKITCLKVQELVVWSWGFLLLFPEVRQRLSGFLVLELLAEAFSSLAFPAFLQCGCGVNVFGEFGILVLAPAAFVLVASASACWGAWKGSPRAAAAGPPPGSHSTCLHQILRCGQLWRERSGPQLLFCALHFTFSPVAALTIVYAPVPGVGFHCLGIGEEQECYFRRDYRVRLDSSEYANFRGWWLLCCLWQLCVLTVLLLCLCRARTTTAAEAGVTALFCSEFKPQRATFEVVNLLRQTLLAAAVLLFPGGSLPQLYWSCLISGVYFALLHVVEPYRHRGDQLLQSFNTIGGVVFFTTLVVVLALANISAETIFANAAEGWVSPLLHTTASAVLLLVVAAPFCEPLLSPALRWFVAWRDRLGAGARANQELLDATHAYGSLLLEERNTGRGQDSNALPSLWELLLQGMDDIEQDGTRLRTEGSLLPEAVAYGRRFRLEEFWQPDDGDARNKRWVQVYPCTEVLTRETVGRLLPALSDILTDRVGRQGFRRRRPEVRISNKRPNLLLPSEGSISFYSSILLRERKARPAGPALCQLLRQGIDCLGREEESAGTGEQGRRDSELAGRLAHFELWPVRLQEQGDLRSYLQEDQQARHVVVTARGRSMDHQEAVELPELLLRPLEVACLLHCIPPDLERSLRIVTRRPGPPINFPQLEQTPPPPPPPPQPAPTTLGQPASTQPQSPQLLSL